MNSNFDTGGLGRGWSAEYNCSMNLVMDVAVEEDDPDEVGGLPLALMPKDSAKRLMCFHHFEDAAGRTRKINFYYVDDSKPVPSKEVRGAWLERFKSVK